MANRTRQCRLTKGAGSASWRRSPGIWGALLLLLGLCIFPAVDTLGADAAVRTWACYYGSVPHASLSRFDLVVLESNHLPPPPKREGKPVALIATCGYPVEKGADLWEAGMQRYCKHSRLRLLGMLAQRHRGYDTVFMDPEKARLAAEFARKVNESI